MKLTMRINIYKKLAQTFSLKFLDEHFNVSMYPGTAILLGKLHTGIWTRWETDHFCLNTVLILYRLPISVLVTRRNPINMQRSSKKPVPSYTRKVKLKCKTQRIPPDG